MPFDPATIGTTFSAIRGVVSQFSDTPLKQQVIDLQNLLIDLQGRVLEQQNELLIANARIQELERQLSQSNSDPRAGLTFDRQVWWASESREHSADGPFCPACLDDGQGRRQLRVPNGVDAQCPKCENWYVVWPERRQHSAHLVRRSGWLEGL
jgi:hypothetical protein